MVRYKGLVVLVVGIGCVFGVMVWMGSRLPVTGGATVGGGGGAPRERVWELISDTAEESGWRHGVRYVGPLPPQDGADCWKETQAGIVLPFCVAEEMGMARRVVKVGRPTKGIKRNVYTASWTFELEEGGSGTMVRITEARTERSALRRFLEHYAIGDDVPVRTYLEDLRVEAGRER